MLQSSKVVHSIVISTLFSFNPAGHAGHHFDNELPWVPPQLEPYEQLLYGIPLSPSIPALQSYRTLSPSLT